VGEVREREARVALRELVVDDHRPEGVEARAAVLAGDGDAEQAELADAAEQRLVQLRELVVLVRLRLHDLAREVADHLPEHAVLFGGVFEIEVGGAHAAETSTGPELGSAGFGWHGARLREGGCERRTCCSGAWCWARCWCGCSPSPR
jgi:hypothetical protein